MLLQILFLIWTEKHGSEKVRWLIGSTSASHQCGPGSIPGWGSDPGAVSERSIAQIGTKPLVSHPSLTQYEGL